MKTKYRTQPTTRYDLALKGSDVHTNSCTGDRFEQNH